MEKLFFTKRMGVVLLFSLLLTLSFSFVSAATIIRDTGISTFDSNIVTTGYVNASDWSDVSITESQISDLSHTSNTNAATICSLDEVLFGNGTCFDSSAFFDGTSYTHLSNFTDDLGNRGYTHLTNFTDDLGNRGYTDLSNFTDDLGNRGYTHLGNFTDDLGNRGYTHLSNFTNDGVFITNDTMNKTVSCSDIIGSPDSDFCTDATGGGSGASDQDLNTTSDVTFNSVQSKTFITATNWTNVTITESQISDLTHTTDTDTWNTSEEMVDAVMSQANTTILHDDAGDEWGVNQTWLTNFINAFGFLTGATNIFDQSLNTTDDVTFDNITISNFIQTATHNFNFIDDGSDLVLNLPTIGGVNAFRIDTTGSFFSMVANPGVTNNYEMFIFEETQGSSTDIIFYEGGTGHNRIWDSGSMRIGGGRDNLCSNLTDWVDCDTPATGADLVVQDDIWFGGTIFSASGWGNISITESQISDLTHTTNTDTWNTTEEMQDAVGSAFDQSLTYDDAGNEMRVNWTNATITESQVSDLGSYVDTTGDTMTGNLTMGNNAILNQTGGARIYHNGTGWVIIG